MLGISNYLSLRTYSQMDKYSILKGKNKIIVKDKLSTSVKN